MWEWRDETARGQWRLDDSGSWIWDEPSLLERVGLGPASFGPGSAGPGAFGPGPAPAGAPWAPPQPWAPPRAGRPGPWTDVPSWSDADPRTDSWELDALSEETPIFEAVAEDQERDDVGDRRRHGAPEDDEDGHPGAADRVEYRTAPWIPEPSPGSGPFPAQSRSGPRRAAWVAAGRPEGRGPDPDVPARHARSPYADAEGHDADGYDGYDVEDDHATGYGEDARDRVGGRHTLRR